MSEQGIYVWDAFGDGNNLYSYHIYFCVKHIFSEQKMSVKTWHHLSKLPSARWMAKLDTRELWLIIHGWLWKWQSEEKSANVLCRVWTSQEMIWSLNIFPLLLPPSFFLKNLRRILRWEEWQKMKLRQTDCAVKHNL